MERVAFRMKLFAGMEEEYRRRHDALWPELAALLTSKGICDYSIFWDRQTNDLIGVLKVAQAAQLDSLPQEPVMQRWWQYMKDIMETHPTGEPISNPLQEVFHMP